MLADLRESGALEQDADIVALISRDHTYHPDSSEKGIAEVIVAKHRNGPTGKIRLAFLEHLTRFADLVGYQNGERLTVDSSRIHLERVSARVNGACPARPALTAAPHGRYCRPRPGRG